VRRLGLSEAEALARLRERGVLLSPTKPGVLRAVTHLDLSDADIEQASTVVPEALAVSVRA
jgi:acetylornithine/succinyldiaminopimelate/putrescine aminotransferase